MRDALILVARMMKDEDIDKLNEEMIKFGKTRGLWCCDGIMMYPSRDNMDRMFKHMEKKNIKTIMINSMTDIICEMSKEEFHEQLNKYGISCLCRKENIILGVKDDSLLSEHKPKALLVYEDESEIAEMKSYIEDEGYEVKAISLETNLKDEDLKKLLDDILEKDIDAVVMPTADYFNSEDYTAPLVFALYQHGIQVHIAELQSNVIDAITFATNGMKLGNTQVNGQNLMS